MQDLNSASEAPLRPEQGGNPPHVTYFLDNAQVILRRRVPPWMRVAFGVFGLLGLVTSGALLLAVSSIGQPLLYIEALLAMLGCGAALTGAIVL